MFGFTFFTIAFLWNCLIAVQASHNSFVNTSYSSDQAEISLWLSSAAYCGKSDYESHTFTGPATGFVVTKVISVLSDDTQGFIGYLPSDKSIYVVFRGSSSIRNWIVNLDVFKTAYTSFPECNCEVHNGFYDAEQLVITNVTAEVTRLQSQNHNYSVKTTGHSLGAALAQLTAMDLIKAGISVTMYNFGQPRVGDQKFSAFATSILPTVRVTHDTDIVPHIPIIDFYHACTEAFENVDGKVSMCDASCEDPTCADQYTLRETSVEDHLVYLGMDVTCSSV